jgi:hypothetical protein
VKNRFQNLPFKCNLQRYTEEVLVTKSDLEEKRGRMSELELQVGGEKYAHV